MALGLRLFKETESYCFVVLIKLQYGHISPPKPLPNSLIHDAPVARIQSKLMTKSRTICNCTVWRGGAQHMMNPYAPGKTGLGFGGGV